jgi:hypothetical protein
MSHFPDVDRMEAVTAAWPRLFAEPPVGMQPLAIDDDHTLIVLCQAANLVAHVLEHERELVGGLNDLLDRRWSISAVQPVPATATEMYLAREVFALKIWLRDFDPGF